MPIFRYLTDDRTQTNINILTIVAIAKKCLLPSIATLADMMWIIWNYDSSHHEHGPSPCKIWLACDLISLAGTVVLVHFRLLAMGELAGH